MITRPERPVDHLAVRALITPAFGDEGRAVADVVEDLRGETPEPVALVAEVGGEIVGHVG